jgi:outer membrane protein OmpA-like peptidoglycan-associated protein
VNFDNDMAVLRPEASAILDQAAESLKAWGDVKVEVAGHTDSRSSDAYNMTLSQNRANAVREYLVGKGIAAERLTAKGYGESQPVADNDTEEGRFKNRRVELIPQK